VAFNFISFHVQYVDREFPIIHHNGSYSASSLFVVSTSSKMDIFSSERFLTLTPCWQPLSP